MHKGLQDTQCERDILLWCQGFKGWTKADSTLGIGWKRANFDFVLGRNGTSVGHLLIDGNLTMGNFQKVNEMINFIKGGELG